MIELEMDNLKNHHVNVVQSQKIRDTQDKATMVGLSIEINKKDLEETSTSPETRNSKRE